MLQSTTITFSRCHTLEDKRLASIFLALVLTLAPGVSNKIAFSTHHGYLGTTYMGGKKLSIIIVYRIKGCFSFRLYTGVFCSMEHLDDMSKLSTTHGLYAVAALAPTKVLLCMGMSPDAP